MPGSAALGQFGEFAFEQGFDWQGATLDVVRRYPIPCVLGAAALGFWIGRHRGKAIAAAAAGLATNAVMRQLSRALETTDF